MTQYRLHHQCERGAATRTTTEGYRASPQCLLRRSPCGEGPGETRHITWCRMQGSACGTVIGGSPQRNWPQAITVDLSVQIPGSISGSGCTDGAI
jgi:hypothetical protein